MNTAADMVFANTQDDDGSTVEALMKALVDDGFASYVVGSKEAPTALVAAYEGWPDHVDMVVIPLGGPAAAARFARPADPLQPPNTAEWTFVGEPLTTIWALLNLRHPDHPDSPHHVLETPGAMRLGRQRPLAVRKPEPGKAASRARRLSRERHRDEISHTFLEMFFAQLDVDRSAVAFSENFTPDGALRMPGWPEIVGQTAIALFTASLFDAIADVDHRINRFWQVDSMTAVAHGVVTFTRHDGSKLSEPFAVIIDFIHDDDDRLLISRWEVCADYSKLHPGTGVDSPQDHKAVVATG